MQVGGSAALSIKFGIDVWSVENTIEKEVTSRRRMHVRTPSKFYQIHAEIEVDAKKTRHGGVSTTNLVVESKQ